MLAYFSPDTHPSTSCQEYRRSHWCRYRHSQGWCNCFSPYSLFSERCRQVWDSDRYWLRYLRLSFPLQCIPAPLTPVATRQVAGKGLHLLATFTVHLVSESFVHFQSKTRSLTFVVPLAAITKFLLPSGQRINSQEVSKSSGTCTVTIGTRLILAL